MEGMVIVTKAVLLLLFGYHISLGQDKVCISRDYNEGSIVCVCNASYCDTIETVNKLPAGQYWVITSTKDGQRFNKQQHNISEERFESANEDLVLTINHKERFQEIFGFGGAFTDAATINLMNLTKESRNNLLKSYFSTEGIEYTFGRVPIGGCDFSTRLYTYDDVQNTDFNLSHFELANEDLAYKIPMIQQALGMSNRTILMFASPWSAPAWMKTNNALNGQGGLRGEPGKEYYQAWADYFVRFLEEYQKHNISFWGLTAQNEPMDGRIADFPFNCMGFTATSQRIFIEKNLGPTLEKKSFGNVKLMILDDQTLMLPGWAKEVLNENYNAKDYVDGIAFHWYLNFIVPSLVLTNTHKLFPNKFLLATESCEGSQPFHRHVILGDWQRGENYAHDIIKDLLHWTTGWVDWNICLNVQGGPNWTGSGVDSPVIVNASKDEFYKQPMYYALGHFSKFVTPGSVVIQATGGENVPGFEYIAFEHPDNATILITLNKNDKPFNIAINDSNIGSFQVLSPQRSIQTFIWWK